MVETGFLRDHPLPLRAEAPHRGVSSSRCFCSAHDSRGAHSGLRAFRCSGRGRTFEPGAQPPWFHVERRRPRSGTDGQLAALGRTENCTPQSSIGRTSLIRRNPDSSFPQTCESTRRVMSRGCEIRYAGSLARCASAADPRRPAAGIEAQALYRPRSARDASNASQMILYIVQWPLTVAYLRQFGTNEQRQASSWSIRRPCKQEHRGISTSRCFCSAYGSRQAHRRLCAARFLTTPRPRLRAPSQVAQVPRGTPVGRAPKPHGSHRPAARHRPSDSRLAAVGPRRTSTPEARRSAAPRPFAAMKPDSTPPSAPAISSSRRSL